MPQDSNKKIGRSCSKPLFETIDEAHALADPQGGALISASDIRFPWDQQTDETEGEHSLWKLYFDQGPTRSFEKLSIIANRNVEFLKGLSERLNWNQRTASYEAYVESVIGSLVKKQIMGNQQTATRIIGEVISHKASRLAQKILLEPSAEEDTVEVILGQLKNLTAIFKTLKSGKADGENAKSRSINIMFAPTIQTGDSCVQEVPVTYEEADTDD